MNTRFQMHTLAATLLLFGLAACEATVERPEPPVSYIKLSDLKKELTIGTQYRLTAELLPVEAAAAAEAATVVWASSRPEVAAVSEDNVIGKTDSRSEAGTAGPQAAPKKGRLAAGLVSALAAGNTVITATVGNVTAQCALSVTQIPVRSLTLDRTELELDEHSAFQLTATVLPENATDRTVSWTSSHPETVSVKEGLVTALRTGTAVITARAGGQEASCNVVVLGSEPVLMPPTLEIPHGGTGELKVTLPVSLRGTPVSWSSEDEAKATVSAHADNSCLATVTAVGYGEVRIRAEVAGRELSCQVVIPASVSLDLDSYADPAAFEEAVKAFDAQGVREYVLRGSILLAGFVETGRGHNAFHEAPNVEVIDFSGCTDWEKLKTKLVLASSTPPCPKPGKIFEGGFGKGFNPGNGEYSRLRRLVFPSGLKVLGRFAIANIPTLEEIIAPGAAYFHKESFKSLSGLKTVRLTSMDNFLYGTDAAEYPFQGAEEKLKANCVLHLHAGKGPVSGNRYFGIEFKEVILEE